MVVPKHIINQGKFASVGVLNCTKEEVVSLKNEKINYFDYFKNEKISNLKSPFNKPDIVIFHGVYIPVFTKLANQLKDENIPYVICPHGSFTHSAQKKKKLKKLLGNKMIFNKFFKGAIAIQYLTNKERETSIIQRNTDIIVPNGIEVECIKDKKIFHDNEFNITFIGRLDPYHKGIDILIKAVKSIESEIRLKNIKLRLYGPDHEGGRSKIDKLIKTNQLQDIVYLGNALYDEEKYTELIKSNIFIQTSRFEGQPLGVLEALSYGVPVIVTPGTNIADEIEENGCGFKADFTVESISEKILEAYEKREILSGYSKKALMYVRKNLAWEVIAQNAIMDYKDLVQIDPIIK